jgi:hypothetical protein
MCIAISPPRTVWSTAPHSPRRPTPAKFKLDIDADHVFDQMPQKTRFVGAQQSGVVHGRLTRSTVVNDQSLVHSAKQIGVRYIDM